MLWYEVPYMGESLEAERCAYGILSLPVAGFMRPPVEHVRVRFGQTYVVPDMLRDLTSETVNADDDSIRLDRRAVVMSTRRRTRANSVIPLSRAFIFLHAFYRQSSSQLSLRHCYCASVSCAGAKVDSLLRQRRPPYDDRGRPWAQPGSVIPLVHVPSFLLRLSTGCQSTTNRSTAFRADSLRLFGDY